MSVDLPNQFFTPESMGTLAGATAITLLLSNTAQKAFNFNPKWLALLIAQVVCFVGAFASGDPDPLGLFVAFINGCLVYLTAVGGTAVASGGSRAADEPVPAPRTGVGAGVGERRGFATPWF